MYILKVKLGTLKANFINVELNQFQQEWFDEHTVHMMSVLYYIQDGQKNYSDMSLITSLWYIEIITIKKVRKPGLRGWRDFPKLSYMRMW